MEKRSNYSILLNLLSYSNQVKMNNKFSKTRKQTEPHMTFKFHKDRDNVLGRFPLKNTQPEKIDLIHSKVSR